MLARPRLLTLLVLLLASVAGHDARAAEFERYAYLLADQPGTATYPPNTLYASQTVGSGARISRLAIGTYQVRLLGFMAGRPAGGTVQVTSFNTPNFCNLASWIASGSDLLVNVRCWRTSNQTAVDAAFTLMVAFG